MPAPISKKLLRTITGYQRRDKQVSALRTMGIDYRINPRGDVVVIDSDLPLNNSESKKPEVRLNLDAAT